MKPDQLTKLKEIAASAIRNKFDTVDSIEALSQIDTAIECGLHELANEMANDYLSDSDSGQKTLFKSHFTQYKEINGDTILRVFDASVKAVIFDSMPRGYMGIGETQLS